MKKKFLVMTLALILTVLIVTVEWALAQPDTLWTKTFGGSGNDGSYYVQQTLDGGYVIAGITSSYGAGSGDAWLIKTNAIGDTTWTRTFGGSEYDGAYSAQQTDDGGYIIAGLTASGNTGYIYDISLIKTDSNGISEWAKTFGGSDSDIGESVQQTSDGGYIITGWTYSAGDKDVWIIKTDANGDTIWTKTFGGNDDDRGMHGMQTLDGGYIITGRTTTYGAGDKDVWLIKTDSLGDTLWTKTFGGTGYDVGESVKQTSDGGYIIVGSTSSYGAGNSDVWLIKTDALGNTLWTKTFGKINDDSGLYVEQTSDEGYIISGYIQHYTDNFDVWIIKTNSFGDSLWSKSLGGNDWDKGNCVKQTSDGGYIVTGYTQSYSAGGTDVWLIKLAPEDTSGLVAYYPFNGNANDESGNGNDGAEYGGVSLTTDRFGNANSAYSFDGVDDKIVVTNSNSINLSSSITVSVWVYPKGTPPILSYGTHSHILSKTNSNNYGRSYQVDYCVDHNDQDNGFFEFIANPIYSCYTPISYSVNNWYHILGIIDTLNNVGKTYVNGQLCDSKEVSENTFTPTNGPLVIGYGELAAHFFHFNGIIDDIRIYNRTLTESEIDSLYHEGGWDQYTGHTTFSDDFTFFDTTKWVKHDAGSNNVNVDEEVEDVVYVDAARNWEPACRITHEMHTDGDDFYAQFDINWTGGNGGGFEVGWSATNEYCYVQSHSDYSTLEDWDNFVALHFGGNGAVLLAEVDTDPVNGTGIVIHPMVLGTCYTVVFERADSLITGQVWTVGKDSLLGELTTTVSRIDNYKYFHISTWDNMCNNWHSYYNIDNLLLKVGDIANDSIFIYVNSLNAFPNDTLLIPINVQFPTNKLYDSAELKFSGYQNGLDFIEVDTSSSMTGDAGWSYAVNEIGDSLITSWFAGAEDISGSGVFCWLKFAVTGEPCTFVPVNIESALFNTGEDSVVTTNGGVYIEPIPVYGDADEDGEIHAHDAALILKHLVEIDTLECQGLANADVTLNDTVTALDASIILQYGVGLIDTLPYDTTAGSLLAMGNMWMEDGEFEVGQIIEVPLNLSEGNNILSFEGLVTYNPEHLTYNDVQWSNLLDGFFIEANEENGEIKFAGAGSSPDGHNGVFATLRFTVNNDFNGDQTTVSLTRIRLNECAIENDAAIATLTKKTATESDLVGIPTEYTLSQNYPNPFNPVTTIQYAIPEKSHVTMTIYNIAGQVVDVLENQAKEAGYYSVQWNASKVGSGVYLYKIDAGGFSDVKKCVILK